MPLAKKTTCSEKDYLKQEKTAVDKHEFHNGEIFVMAGASTAHCAISFNINIELGVFLRDKACSAYGSDMKVNIRDKKHPSQHYVYPDTLVTCDENDLSRTDGIVQNPKLIIEVLSPSTEGYDWSEKFELYRQLDSLQDYVLISQEKKKVEIFSRANGDIPAWIISTYDEEEKDVHIPSINFRCDMDSIYNKVRFKENEDPAVAE